MSPYKQCSDAIIINSEDDTIRDAEENLASNNAEESDRVQARRRLELLVPLLGDRRSVFVLGIRHAREAITKKTLNRNILYGKVIDTDNLQ